VGISHKAVSDKMISDYQRQDNDTFIRKNGKQPFPRFEESDFCKRHNTEAELIESIDLICCPYCFREISQRNLLRGSYNIIFQAKQILIDFQNMDKLLGNSAMRPLLRYLAEESPDYSRTPHGHQTYLMLKEAWNLLNVLRFKEDIHEDTLSDVHSLQRYIENAIQRIEGGV